MDLIAPNLPKLAAPGEVMYVDDGFQLHVGGHPVNVALDLRQTGLPAKEVSVIGDVGEDLFGELIEERLERGEILTHLRRNPEVRTAKNVILVVKGEDRRFHVDPGANLYLDANRVRKTIREESPTVFYVAAGMEGEFDEKLSTVLKEAKAHNCLTFVDIVEPWKKDWEFIVPAFKFTDIFHCNDDELRKITGIKELEKGINALLDSGIDLIITSMGSKGSAIKTNHVKMIYQKSFDVPIVDPTGAGDALCAGIIRELTVGKIGEFLGEDKNITSLSENQLSEILRKGQATAAACVTAPGATTAVTEKNIQLIEEKSTTI